MKTYNLIFIFFLLLISCSNRNSQKSEEKLSVQPVLDTLIFDAVRGLIKHNDLNIHPIIVYFTDSLSDSYKYFMKTDSVVFIEYYDEKTNDFPLKYYKGTLDMDSILIILSDKNNIGSPYYDSSLILPTPLNELNKTSLEVSIFSIIEIKNDSLKMKPGCE